jgi:predicted Zn-dependent protease
MKGELPRADARAEAYVECVADAVTRQVEPQRGWEVVVFREQDANAFALPGGKIGVFTGMLDVAENQDQLATVIAHEVAHVVADHPNERLSTAYAAQQGLQLAQVMAGGPSGQRSQLMGLLGLGAQFGVLMPFDRAQEREADLVGLDLMAKAGFDPSESIGLWQNMARAGGAQPPEFLSTHPSTESRMAELRARLPRAQQLYARTRARPECDGR